jgi:iron complex outermembrane recepter protein
VDNATDELSLNGHVVAADLSAEFKVLIINTLHHIRRINPPLQHVSIPAFMGILLKKHTPCMFYFLTKILFFMTTRIVSCVLRIAYRVLRCLMPIAFCLLFTPLSIFAQNFDVEPDSVQIKQDSLKAEGYIIDKVTLFQEFVVTATMANERTPMTFTNLNREKIRKNDFGQDIPFLLQSTPSVVETSDAGAGVGYTGLRVRGSDATRTNVTVDGIPLNDSESQSVYWVNMPDFANSTSMIQIQRGVGTSTNGAGAFGSTINLTTNSILDSKKSINYSGSIGSFNTQKHSISFGSGILGEHFTINGRLSRITSDGYVDRASSKLGSVYLSAKYWIHGTSLRFKIFTGNERTYQSWYGIPFSYITDSKLRTYNPSGTEKADTPYPNQVDDYQQTHSHLTFDHEFSRSIKLNASLHYTLGKGFYEEYKSSQKLPFYFLTDSIKVGNEWVKKTDLTRRLWLDNHFYGGVFSLTFKSGENEFIVGGGVNRYDGKHFGQVLWADKIPIDASQPKTFYESTANKTDANIYAKLNYQIGSKTYAFVDLQARSVGHKTQGFDRKQRDISRDLSWFFFNPKAGLVHNYTAGGQFYGSFSVGNREPNRNDILDAVNNKTPQSERLLNTELGWKLNRKKVLLSANFYHMAYKNQLVVTGQINDVGEQLRINVPTSYRAGFEAELSWKITENLRFDYNATLSQNKISDFTEYRDNWDTGEQDAIKHGTTDIAFSPNVIANASLTYQIMRGSKHQLEIALSGKHVGKQYVDNTSNENAILDDYKYGNLRIQYKTGFGKMKNFTAKLLINNILDSKYSSNAWVYRFNSPSYDERPDNPYTRLENGSVYNQMGYFPQAGRNFLLGFSVEF